MLHTQTTSLNICSIPAFQDNYIWLIHNSTSSIVIDPGDATRVLQILKTHNLTLSAILLTHHHADHTDGVPCLLNMVSVPVYGPSKEYISSVNQPVQEGDQIYISTLKLNLKIIEVPGHTYGHIAYFAQKEGWLFSGDTLFTGGCGKLFEGTPEQMANSLTKLAMLPDTTKIYCGHEYTLSNLYFARTIEPNNTALNARIAMDQKKLNCQLSAVPSTLELEKKTNPFLRYTQPVIIASLQKTGYLPQNFLVKKNPIIAFAALREWKNNSN